MTEQELREKIARKLCELKGLNWEYIDENYKRLFGQATPRESYRSDANEIMPLIKSACWLKGEQELPKNPYPDSIKFHISHNVYDDTQQDILKAGFKACREWEKECAIATPESQRR